MTSTASILSAGEILKQDPTGRVRTPLGKRQEILAAFGGAGMSAARFAAMSGTNYSTFCSWVQGRNQKLERNPALLGASANPQVQWIEAEIAPGTRRPTSSSGNGMEVELLGGGARMRIWDERDAGEHISQILVRIDAASTAAFDDGVDHGAALSGFNIPKITTSSSCRWPWAESHFPPRYCRFRFVHCRHIW